MIGHYKNVVCIFELLLLDYSFKNLLSPSWESQPSLLAIVEKSLMRNVLNELSLSVYSMRFHTEPSPAQRSLQTV